MAKQRAKSQRKKRVKTYTGEDAAIQGERVTKIKAVKKNPVAEWYSNNKKRLAGWGILTGIILIFYYLISFLVGWIF